MSEQTADWLRGIRVIELGQFLSAPYGGMILADLGAEVIKVEEPLRGDAARRMGQPFGNGDALLFRDLNRGKRSVALDFKSDPGRASLLKLIESADIVISNLRPGIVAQHGIDGPTLAARFPRLVYCDLSAFGRGGPLGTLPGFEPLAQAYSGLASVNGTPDGPPLRTGPSIVDMGSGMWIAISAMAALRKREQTGRGAVIDLSLLDTAFAWISMDVSGYLNEGRAPERRANGHPLLVPYDAFPAQDGPLVIAAGNDGQFARLAGVLGHPEWATMPDYATNAARMQNKPALVARISAILREKPREHWIGLLQQAGVPCSSYNTIPEAIASEQVRQNAVIKTSARTGRQLVGLPFTIDGCRPGSLEEAPRLGQDNDLISA
ncbi:CaiB/BaiF CoA transferase family protein [Bordetella petrii]|uniref:CaiB/BaiF CoA transferase family protein n=1 Tax=Bordetella petrii TaxID=94624 RepID=UPI001E4EAF06|nr:CoA transferase [Bordetella petrii]MCD0504282.1 CoA transferase [Bordetella petrii]